MSDCEASTPMVRIAEFAETVHNKLAIDTISKAFDQWAVGIWLGKTLRRKFNFWCFFIINKRGCNKCQVCPLKVFQDI